MESIIVALITGVLSLVGVVITNTAAARRTENKITTAQAVTDTKPVSYTHLTLPTT